MTLVQNQRTVFECNFDNAVTAAGCNGIFYYNIDGQQAGVLQYLEATSTELSYDLTDLTSTSIFIKIF